MTITFFTNLIHHHQAPIADEFYRMLGNNYTFVATTPLPQSFKDGGYPDYLGKPYLLKSYESIEAENKAMELGLQSDIVIIGSAPDFFIEERLKLNKLTFRYSERLFKKIDYHLLSPRAWYYWYNNHTKYRNKNLYMLCASGYTSYDVSKIFGYPNKCLKWGYFTEVENLDIQGVIEKKRNQCFTMIWVSRFIDWKHPELIIKAAKILKFKGYNFHLNMIGSGILQEEMKSLVLKLQLYDCVSFLGNMSNEKTLKIMRESNAFIFTSDRNEGWGAVLNESMSNGCAVVASNLIGSVPYLIKNNQNGLIFESENLDSLFLQIQRLISDRKFCERIAINAYNTLKSLWNPKNAAKSFMDVGSSLLKGDSEFKQEGPCSKA
jgi:glycosyltransferase involved in cell wall biosynthesis